MRHGEAARAERREADREFGIGLARAFAGAVFFSLPLLMTMEMWWLGFSMGRLQLALFMAAMLPLLVALDHYSGFIEGTTWAEDVVDALVAYAVAFAAAAAVLFLFGVLTPDLPLREVVGKVALQAVPGSFGAVLASSQLGAGRGRSVEDARKEHAGYRGELLFMTAGAVFLAFNVAPTEEMILISYRMTPWHALGLAAASLSMMHGFVYAVGFRGAPAAERSGWSRFVRFTAVGYAIALAVSAYVLWTFGRFDDHAWTHAVMHTVVLAFPASLGAAAARLIL